MKNKPNLILSTADCVSANGSNENNPYHPFLATCDNLFLLSSSGVKSVSKNSNHKAKSGSNHREKTLF